MNEVIPPVQKKIKLVVSDLHLGKGRQLENGSLNSLEEFYYAEKLVEFIQYYSTGAYRDYDVEIVINGDFLNFLQVDYRGHFLTVITESIAVEILKSVIKGHPQRLSKEKPLDLQQDCFLVYQPCLIYRF